MKYVALIRGVGPGNPNMTGAKFKEFFESLGFKNVTPVISSGNVVFESNEDNTKKLEEKIERELPKQLGFLRAVFVRSEGNLKEFVAKNPFKEIKDEKPNYLLVTFFKDGQKELCTVLNTEKDKTTNFMAKMDKKNKMQITSRTWKTVNRILKTMEKSN